MSQKEKELLVRDGIEARIRNKLSSIKNIFSMIAMYAKEEDSTKALARLSPMEKLQASVDESFSVMTFIATEKGNHALQKKLKELNVCIVEAYAVIDEHRIERGKHKAFLFSAKSELHEALIEEIITIGRNGS